MTARTRFSIGKCNSCFSSPRLSGCASSSKSAGAPPRSSTTMCRVHVAISLPASSVSSFVSCAARWRACACAMFRAPTVWSRWNNISRAENACHSARCGCSVSQGRWDITVLHAQARNALWARDLARAPPSRRLQQKHLAQPGVEPVLCSSRHAAARYEHAPESRGVVDHADAHGRCALRGGPVREDLNLVAPRPPGR